MKLLIWTNIPNHYQRSFFDALRQAGIDLRVCYYEHVDSGRRKLGWSVPEQLPPGECYVPQSPAALDMIEDWPARIHIIPGGYTSLFLRNTLRRIVAAKVPWAHWSEPSKAHGLRRWLTAPLKRRYAAKINQTALGAFGIGQRAMADFTRWGVASERTAMLPYSAPPADLTATPDSTCASFCAGRPAFLFLGSLCHRKGIDVLLSAFARAGRRSLDSVLILVGNDTTNGGYLRLARKLKIADRVLFRGPVAPDQLSRVMRTAQVLVLPSRVDGWGVVLNEGASAGLALIGSDMAGASYHLIRPGENGFRVRAGSTSSLATALAAYAEHPDIAACHGAQSLEIFAEYTPARNVQRLIRSIESWQCLRGRVENARQFGDRAA